MEKRGQMIEKLKDHFIIADMLSGEPELRRKLNVVIDVLNNLNETLTDVINKHNEQVNTALNRQKYNCPICGERGVKLSEYLGGKYIYACPKCHSLFWED